MSCNEENQSDWRNSQPGDVGQLVQRLQGRRRALATQQLTVGALLVLLTAFTGYYFVGVLPNAQPNFGGIVCERVHELMPQYMANSLDVANSRRIHDHLQRCKNCRSEMERMAPGSLPQSSTAKDTPSGIALNRPAQNWGTSRRTSIDGLASLSR